MLAHEVNRYVNEVSEVSCSNALEFWNSRESSYQLLAPTAHDIVCAPASEAFVEVYSHYVEYLLLPEEIE